MIKITESLDPLCIPLRDARLIEASAGTGKTFTITSLYLRLLLGLGGNAAFSHPLSVKDILVVTFTEAATAELRRRIQASIHELRIACLRQNTNNPLFKRLLNEIADKEQASHYLLLAERQMDEAAIFTIHGFCQRILRFNAFESGMLYECQLIEDESELRYQACIDFWRRHCYQLPPEVAKVIYAQWKSPEGLLFSIDPYLQGEAPTIKFPPEENETLVSRHEKIISRIDKLKKNWRSSASEIKAIIEQSGIDRNKFNRTNQIKWIEKINSWAHEKTCGYQLPTILKKFSQRFLMERTKPGGIIPKHSIFIAIDNFLVEPLTLNDLMLARAMVEIRETVSHEKRRRGEIGFDDMVGYLEEALNSENGEELAAIIRTHFPVAIIDEFQDTDPKQCRIFFRIWNHQPETALLLIGDPKQAIYSFRGANIFTYIRACNEVEACYTLNRNWRSMPGIVNGVNTIYTQMDLAFIFPEIPFLPVKPADKNIGMRFEFQGKTQPAMRFWLMDGEGCSVKDYQSFMAKQAAAQIRDWLNASAQGEALLWREKVSQPIDASDIAVLVRSRHEAMMVRDALMLLGIPSVYLSNRDSVFDTLEAQEIFWILQAILSPEQTSMLRSALASSILGLTALDIDFLNTDEPAWNAVVEEFSDYRDRWKKCGVMVMLRELIMRRQIAENMLVTPGGERRLTNIMHISELLQEASLQLESDPALIRWLSQQIAKPNGNAANQQIRLENDKCLVQIMTIHKSKGLEYPLVWLPFIANYRIQDKGFYHDPVSFKLMLDLNLSEESMKLAETERLAEDLRLLYVALTRSIWHCSLGVAPLFQRPGKKIGQTDFHHSAIGYLIQKGEPKDAAGLRLALENLCNEDVTLHIPDMPNNTRLKLVDSTPPKLATREIYRTVIDNWRVTSYSELRRYSGGISRDPISKLNIQDMISKLDINLTRTTEVRKDLELTLHQFPQGIKAGIFLHGLLKELDFTHPVSTDWVLEVLQKGGYQPYWQPVLSEWINLLLEVPLIDNGLSLSQLSEKEKLVEMEFYIPINDLLKASSLDKLTRKYDPLSKMCTPLNFQQVRGFLKGFIDLVFCYEGRYYLLDYKSNTLGENNNAYTREAIATTMCSHRYDLQYQIYTIALHRYLAHRIPNYSYETHFGEVIYLFLRGIDGSDSRSGIFTTRPTETLIKSIDRMFSEGVQDMD